MAAARLIIIAITTLVSSSAAFVSPVRKACTSHAPTYDVDGLYLISPPISTQPSSLSLFATIDDGNIQTNSAEIIQRLELTEQFSRWRFMQKLLEAELPASDIEDVLLSTLYAYLQHGPSANSANNKNENGGNASPVLTDQQRSIMTN